MEIYLEDEWIYSIYAVNSVWWAVEVSKMLEWLD